MFPINSKIGSTNGVNLWCNDILRRSHIHMFYINPTSLLITCTNNFFTSHNNVQCIRILDVWYLLALNKILHSPAILPYTPVRRCHCPRPPPARRFLLGPVREKSTLLFQKSVKQCNVRELEELELLKRCKNKRHLSLAEKTESFSVQCKSYSEEI